MKHCFFINPTAGHIDAEKCKESIVKLCSSRNLDFEVFISTKRGDIIEYARDCADKYEEVMEYAVGGDGTISETVDGIMKSKNENAIMVPVPCGSGNDFVRSFGYEKAENFDVLLERVMRPEIRSIDVTKINDRFGVNVSSAGFDAKVVANAYQFKMNPLCPDKMSYTVSVFYTFITQGAYNVKLKIDDKDIDIDKILLIDAANGQYYGGGMKPFPEAVVDDGLLEFMVVEKVSKPTIAKFFPKFKKGEANKIKQAHFYKGRKLEIISDKDLPINIDGEVSFAKSVVFELCDRKLKLGVMALD